MNTNQFGLTFCPKSVDRKVLETVRSKRFSAYTWRVKLFVLSMVIAFFIREPRLGVAHYELSLQ